MKGFKKNMPSHSYFNFIMNGLIKGVQSNKEKFYEHKLWTPTNESIVLLNNYILTKIFSKDKLKGKTSTKFFLGV